MKQSGPSGPSQQLAYKILERLLKKEQIKEIAYEEDIHISVVYKVRKMFPLFFIKDVE